MGVMGKDKDVLLMGGPEHLNYELLGMTKDVSYDPTLKCQEK